MSSLEDTVDAITEVIDKILPFLSCNYLPNVTKALKSEKMEVGILETLE